MSDETLRATEAQARAFHDMTQVGGPWSPCGGTFGVPLDCLCFEMASDVLSALTATPAKAEEPHTPIEAKDDGASPVPDAESASGPGGGIDSPLPVRAATPPPPLDVERLARALHRWMHGRDCTTGDVGGWDASAAEVAAEYARLATREPER